MKTGIRLTAQQYQEAKQLLRGVNALQQVIVLLCGHRHGANCQWLLGRALHRIPFEGTPTGIRWDVERLNAVLRAAAEEQLHVAVVHPRISHPPNPSLSLIPIDSAIVQAAQQNLSHNPCCASLEISPESEMTARFISPDENNPPLDVVSVVGDDLCYWFNDDGSDNLPEFTHRHQQAFGAGTTRLLRKLSVAVVGCSGTGSPVVEQLVRLGIRRLVLVDPDIVEEKNLNRIMHATMQDAQERRPKVQALAEDIARAGLGTEVEPLVKNLQDTDVIKAVAECDAVFGCMDSAEGRDVLNRLSTFYLLPYIDLGVHLEADGQGSINKICGSVHYLQPTGSTLLDRGMYTLEQLHAEALLRTDSQAYHQQLDEGYIVGVQENSPAVISVNNTMAAMAVNEFLARLHPHRNEPNEEYAIHYIDLTESSIFHKSDRGTFTTVSKDIGRGDMEPPLGRPSLSAGGEPS